MCDYSLMGVPSRLARQGEDLVTYTFGSRTKGMTSPESLLTPKARSASWYGLKKIFQPASVTAVCIPPGARLEVYDIPAEIQRCLHVGAVETVTFAQLSMEEYTHRDGIRFDNGTELSLQCLTDGQRVKVLSFSLESDLREDVHIFVR